MIIVVAAAQLQCRTVYRVFKGNVIARATAWLISPDTDTTVLGHDIPPGRLVLGNILVYARQGSAGYERSQVDSASEIRLFTGSLLVLRDVAVAVFSSSDPLMDGSGFPRANRRNQTLRRVFQGDSHLCAYVDARPRLVDGAIVAA